MTTVILAEKPDQALSYAKSFKKYSRKNGYYEISDPLFNGDTYITYGIGHLVGLALPEAYNPEYKKWDLKNLPIFPDEMIFTVDKSKKAQFSTVKNLLQKADEIIIATDPDREGENIAWSIINQAKLTGNKTYKRLWINSLEEDVIYEGMKNLLNAEETKNYYIEAQTRQIADWLVGMNASPLFTLSLQKKGVSGVFSIGRVQTPTLYMIYKRNKEIENFKKEKFYELETTYEKDDISFKGILKPNKSFKAQDDINTFLNDLNLAIGQNKAIVSDVIKKDKSKSSPSLFSLSELQKLANKLYKKSPKETLNAVQKLYDSKYLTYPRTSCKYITDSEFKYLKENLATYKDFLNLDIETPNIEARKQYVNNAKVLEHHAIVLTKRVPNKDVYQNLSTFEQQIYQLVALRTVSMFMSDYTYQETIIKTELNSLNFETKGIKPIDLGWRQLEKKAPSENLLPEIMLGETLDCDLIIQEKETSAPSYYSEGTLISAMKNLGKEIEDEDEKQIMNEIQGLGTEATRGDIIETLKRRKYIAIEKNKVIVTETGKLLCQAIESEKLLSSPEMTSKWELYLKQIGKGNADPENFIKNIKKFITHLIDVTPQNVENVDFEGYQKKKELEEEKNIVGVCPNCKNNIVLKKTFYGCSGYPTCKFTLPNNFRKKKLSKTQVSKLLKGEEIVVRSIKTKNDNKKTYNARIGLKENGSIQMIGFEK